MMLKTTESPIGRTALYELFVLSAFTFILSALLLQFLMNLQTAILLRYYSISFTYSIFSIHYASVSATKWTPSMIYIVYGIGVLVFFVAGILLLLIKVVNWKVKLALTWLSFIMIHTLPLGMLAGIYFYDGFGIAFTWLFPKIIVRVLIALPLLLIAIYYRRFWILRFLKTSYSKAYLENKLYRKTYIKDCFTLPWFAGAIILSAFALPNYSWIWFVFIIGSGIAVIPIRKAVPSRKILINKSDSKILPFHYPLLYFITLIGAIWLVSLIKISF